MSPLPLGVDFSSLLFRRQENYSSSRLKVVMNKIRPNYNENRQRRKEHFGKQKSMKLELAQPPRSYAISKLEFSYL